MGNKLTRRDFLTDQEAAARALRGEPVLSPELARLTGDSLSIVQNELRKGISPEESAWPAPGRGRNR